MRVPASVPSECPACKLPMWRETHEVTMQFECDREDEGVGAAVCRHCSAIWISDTDPVVWREPRPEDAEVVAALAPYAFRFFVQRAVRAAVGSGAGGRVH